MGVGVGGGFLSFRGFRLGVPVGVHIESGAGFAFGALFALLGCLLGGRERSGGARGLGSW